MADTLRVIPLGGLGEIGKNMMLFEYGDDVIAVDCGLMFPTEEMLGVDLVIPNMSYILDNRKNLRAIFITHGHEDHTGALPYILKQVNVPVYCTPLAHGLISVKLKEARLLQSTDLREIRPGDSVTEGVFTVEPFQVAHSIPDSVGYAIRTPVGTVVHTGDFKLDHTPVMGQSTDLSRLALLGQEGVLLLCADSTYAEVPGYTPSEQIVGDAILQIMAKADGRVIVTTFASLIARVQLVFDAAERTGRRVFITGRSMIDNTNMALERGYLRAPEGMLVSVRELPNVPHTELVIITTGSQGEPTSALTRMANQDHQHVKIVEGDTVILSASAVPGNEALVHRTVDNLFKLGAKVLYNRIADVHVRGHASQEELKIVHALVKPRYFIPVHGEYRHMVLHAQVAESLDQGTDTFIMTDGDVLEITAKGANFGERIEADYVYVDGIGVGDIDHVVLRDRKHLASDGMVVVVIAMDKNGHVSGKPEVISRGFIDLEDNDTLIERAREHVLKSLEGGDHLVERGAVAAQVKESLAKFLYDETRRRPMVLPVAVEV
ncbi:MAG: ribonuclease J [Chloroflexota bacterium]|nr:ribonuclease J [Chloroflexota bacterium]